MIAALLACVFSQAKVVTLDSPGWSVPQILAEVSKQTGQDFEAKDDVRNDHVIVHVDHVPIKDFMDRFGEVLLSSWTMEDGAYVLQRSNELMQAETVASLARVTDAFRTDLEKLRQDVTSEPPFDHARAVALATRFQAFGSSEGPPPDAESRLANQMPIQNAVKQLLVDIGPKRLAEATRNGRAVFAMNPNDFQLPLGPNSKSIIQTMLSEQKIWAAANRSTVMKGPYLTALAWNPFNDFGGCFLSLTPQNGDALYSAELTLFDSDLYMFGMGETELEVKVPSNASPNPIPSALSNHATLTPIEENYFAPFFQRFGEGRVSKQPPDPALALDAFSEANKIDPLSLFVGPVLCEFAKMTHQNLIALGDASLWYAVGAAVSKRDFVPSRFWAQLDRGQIRYDAPNDWLEIRPSDFDQYLRTRWDRPALASFFSIVKATSSEPIDACSEMAYKAFRPSEDDWLLRANDDLAPNLVSGFEPLRQGCQVVYGSLSPELRQAASNGRRLLVAQLGPGPLVCLRYELMGAQFDLRSVTPPSPAGGKKHAYSQTVESEPTLLAGNLPGQAYITIQRSSAQGFTTVTKSKYDVYSGPPRVGNVENVAYELVQMEATKSSDSHPTNFQSATVETVHFEIHFSPTVFVQSDFQSVTGLGPIVQDWKQLPAPIAAKIRADMRGIEAQYRANPNLFSGEGIGRQGAPP